MTGINANELVISENIVSHAKRLWDYCTIPKCTSKSALMLVFGCHDVGVALRAAEMMLDRKAAFVIASGNEGLLTEKNIPKSEASLFEDIFLGHGIEKGRIITEDRARHTLENVRLSRLKLSRLGYKFDSCIAVTKPYSMRRVLALVQMQWESADWCMESEETCFEDYTANDEKYKALTIHFLVGEITRISLYRGKDILYQAIPDSIWSSYYYLRENGWDIDAIGREERRFLSQSAIVKLIEAAAKAQTGANAAP